MALEHTIRRLVGVQAADVGSNWDLCSTLQLHGRMPTLLPMDLLNATIKESEAFRKLKSSNKPSRSYTKRSSSSYGNDDEQEEDELPIAPFARSGAYGGKNKSKSSKRDSAVGSNSKSSKSTSHKPKSESVGKAPAGSGE